MNKAQRLAQELLKVHGHRLAIEAAALLRQQDEALRMALEALEPLANSRDDTAATRATAKIKEVLHD